MIHLPASVRVYLCLSPCDMRRSFDGLHALVRDHLELDAFAGHLYLFANKRRDRLKTCTGTGTDSRSGPNVWKQAVMQFPPENPGQRVSRSAWRSWGRC
jgi:hypothetical protein